MKSHRSFHDLTTNWTVSEDWSLESAALSVAVRTICRSTMASIKCTTLWLPMMPADRIRKVPLLTQTRETNCCNSDCVSDAR